MIHLENQSPKIIHGWCLIIKTYSFPEQQDDKIHLRFFFFFLKGEAEWEAAKPAPDCIAGQQQHTKEICGHKPPRTSSDHWLFPFHISTGDLIWSDLHWREHPIPQSFGYQVSRWKVRALQSLLGEGNLFIWQETNHFPSGFTFFLRFVVCGRERAQSCWGGLGQRISIFPKGHSARNQEHQVSYACSDLIFCCHSIRQGQSLELSICSLIQPEWLNFRG